MNRLVAAGLCAVLACVSVGCSELDKAQYALHEEQHRNITVFGEVSNAFTDAADDMAGKKHDLQGQIIKKASDSWVKDHTNAEGVVTATPAELATMLAQRDEAVATLVQSKAVWSRLSGSYRRAIADLIAVSDTIAAKDADVEKAKQQMKDTAKSVLNVITSVGVGVGIAGIGL